MKRVLVVSPNFPPLNAPDMHRVRTSLPYFREFGWEPHVLAVAPEYQQGVMEPRLLQSLPPDVPVTRIKALPLGLTRRLGVTSIALRAFLHLYYAGARIIRRNHIDLVYISTTMFPAMALGRLWRWRCGTPYVLDMQDPWVDDFNTSARQLPKSRLARMLHGVLEPFTMRGVGGLVAVSAAYNETLRKRYSWISKDMCCTVPFGACDADFAEAARQSWANPFFARNDGHLHGVYAGAVSDPMRVAARILFRALQQASASVPLVTDVRLAFVGTSYAPAGRERKVIEPEAQAEGMAGVVLESPKRVPYFDALRLLLDSDFLLILGSEDSEYTPSKLFQYLLARRPIVAVLHERSPIIGLLRHSRAAVVATFSGPDDVENAAGRLSGPLADLIKGLPGEPDTDWSVVAPFTARELTRQQCVLFDSVSRARALAQRVPCPE